MATRTLVISDLSGEADASTVTVGLHGTWHEVDLTEAERDGLSRTLDPYLRAARKATGTTPQASKRVVPDLSPEARNRIRVWARKKGLGVAEFGQIPNRIVDAYRAAHAMGGE